MLLTISLPCVLLCLSCLLPVLSSSCRCCCCLLVVLSAIVASSVDDGCLPHSICLCICPNRSFSSRRQRPDQKRQSRERAVPARGPRTGGPAPPSCIPRPRSDSVRRASRSCRCLTIRHVAQSFVVSFPRRLRVCDLVSLFLRRGSVAFVCGGVCVTLGVRRPRPRLLVLVGVCASRTLYLSRRAVVCRVASARNRQRAARAAPPRGVRESPVPCATPSPCPFVVLSLYFVCVALASAELLRTPFCQSFVCAWTLAGRSIRVVCAASLRVHARANRLLPPAVPVYSFMVALSPTLIAESCHIPLLRSVQCQSLAVGGPSVLGPRVAVAAATEAPHMSLGRIFQTTFKQNTLQTPHR